MKNHVIVAEILIICGALILLLAIFRTVNILRLDEAKVYRSYWKACLILMVIFLSAYIVTPFLFYKEKVQLIEILAGLVFFLGSLFVYTVAYTSQLTFLGIKKSTKSFTEDISARKKTEEGLLETTLLLQTTFDLAIEGILAVNKQGKIITYNKRFAEMWKIPPEILNTRDDSRTINYVLNQLKEPDKFLEKVKQLYDKPEEESFDVLEFKDGRIFERYSMPEAKNGKIFGRVWDFIDVTEKKKAEKELILSNYRFLQIFNLSPVAIAISTLEKGEFIHVNKKFIELSGYKVEELIGNTSIGLNLISMKERKKITLQLKEVNNQAREFETYLRNKNGEIKDILLSSETIDIDGKLCMATVVVDITEQKETEKRIAASEKRFIQIFNFSPVSLSISRIEDGKLMYVNDTFCKTLGFSREELLGKTSVELKILNPELRNRLKNWVLSQKGKTRDLETSAFRKNGEIIHVLYSIERLEIDGTDSALIAFSNITEIKNSEQKIKMILENIGEGVLVTDTRKKILHCNHAAAEILEISGDSYSEAWTNKYEIYYPDGRTIFPIQEFPLEKSIKGAVTSDSEIVLIDRQTRKKTLLRVSGHPIFSDSNKIIAIVLTIKDITRIRETEKALEESELNYRKIIGFSRNLKD